MTINHANPDALHAVLTAANDLLAARADGMLTSAEWDALEAAVQAACGSRRCPACRTINQGHEVTDPDGGIVCGECGAAHPRE